MTDSGRLDYLSRQEFIAKRMSPYITGEQWQNGLDMRLASIAITSSRVYDELGYNRTQTTPESPANDKPSLTTRETP